MQPSMLVSVLRRDASDNLDQEGVDRQQFFCQLHRAERQAGISRRPYGRRRRSTRARRRSRRAAHCRRVWPSANGRRSRAGASITTAKTATRISPAMMQTSLASWWTSFLYTRCEHLQPAPGAYSRRACRPRNSRTWQTITPTTSAIERPATIRRSVPIKMASSIASVM